MLKYSIIQHNSDEQQSNEEDENRLEGMRAGQRVGRTGLAPEGFDWQHGDYLLRRLLVKSISTTAVYLPYTC